MPEVIKATLTADSSELQAEFAKARQTVNDFHTTLEAGQSKALQAERDQLRLLDLKVNGRLAEADALRQRLTLEAQAEQLAKRTGISEAAAMTMLERKLALQRQLATAAEAADRRQAQAANASATARSTLPAMPLQTSQLNETFMANERLRKSAQASSSAFKSQGMGMLYVAQAMDDVQYGMRGVLNNVPQLVMGFGGTAGLAGGISLAVLAAYTLYKVFDQLSGSADIKAWEENAKKASEAWTKAIEARIRHDAELKRSKRLQIEMEDLHQKEARSITRLLDIDRERYELLKKASERLAEQRRMQDEVTKARQGLAEDREETPLGKLGAKNAAASENFQIQQKRIGEDLKRLDQEIVLYGKDWQRIWENSGKVTARYTQEINVAGEAIETADKKLQRINDELAKQKALLEAPKSNWTAGERHAAEDKVRNLQDQKTETEGIIERQKALKSAAEENLRVAESTLAAARKESDAKKSAAQAEKQTLEERKKSAEELARIEAERLRNERGRELNKQAKDASKSTADDDLDLARFENEQRRKAMGIRGADARSRALEDLGRELESRRELLDLERRAKELAEQTGRDEKEVYKILKEQYNLRQAALKTEREKAAAKAMQDFSGEIKALQLEAAGRLREAQALREEIQIRREAAELADRLRISEEKALELARRKHALEQQAHDRQRGIRRARPGALNAAGGRRAGNPRALQHDVHERHGLDRHESRRRDSQRERRMDETTARQAARYYDRSLSVQEDTLKIWQKLQATQ